MKKVGLLTGLCTILTVSSVYAAWIYGHGTASSSSESVIPQMAGVGEGGQKGDITVKTSGLTMVIDHTGDYKPKLNINGDVLVTFTPSGGADQIVKDYGVIMEYTITYTENWVYNSEFKSDDPSDDKEIFKYTTNYTGAVMLNGGAPTNNINIPASEIAQYVELNVDSEFKIDTRAKFDDFKRCLNLQSALFTIAVREVTSE